MSEKNRRTSECLGNISDVSKRNSDIGAKTSEILFVHSKKYESTSASLTIPLSITQFFAEKDSHLKAWCEGCESKKCKIPGKARVSHAREEKALTKGCRTGVKATLPFIRHSLCPTL